MSTAPVETIVLYTALPALALVAGGATATVRPPGPVVRSAIQHFAAGVVFAVVAVELLPDLRKEHRLWEVGLTFALGVDVMLGLRRLTERKDQAESAGGRLPWGCSSRSVLISYSTGFCSGSGSPPVRRKGRS